MKTTNKELKIAVVGLGYVGLPLSFQFARSGVTVLGLDIDTAKVDALNQGRSYIKHIELGIGRGSGSVRHLFGHRAISAASGRWSAIIICVPDPAEQEPRAGHFLHPDTGKTHCPPLAQGHAGGARIDHVSRHHG